jgi:hypothetical protein
MDPLPNKSMSSTNNKWVRMVCLPIFKPMITPFVLEYIRNLFYPFVAIIERSGDKGKPCINPPGGFKKDVVDPFIRMEKSNSIQASLNPIHHGNIKPYMSQYYP